VPAGVRGQSFPLESRSVNNTPAQEPIGSDIGGCTVTVHGRARPVDATVVAPSTSHPGGLPLLAPATIGADTVVANDTSDTFIFGAIV
jgi:hypothetical protein